MSCPRCGHEIPEESRFCLKCGESLETARPGDQSLDLPASQRVVHPSPPASSEGERQRFSKDAGAQFGKSMFTAVFFRAAFFALVAVFSGFVSFGRVWEAKGDPWGAGILFLIAAGLFGVSIRALCKSRPVPWWRPAGIIVAFSFICLGLAVVAGLKQATRQRAAEEALKKQDDDLPKRKLEEFENLVNTIGSVDLKPSGMTFDKLSQLLHSPPEQDSAVARNAVLYSWLHGAVLAEFVTKDGAPGELYGIMLRTDIPVDHHGLNGINYKGVDYNVVDWRSHISLCGFPPGSPAPEGALRHQKWEDLPWKGPWHLNFHHNDDNDRRTTLITAGNSNFQMIP